MNYIFEREGVMLDVQYRHDADGIASFGEIRVLGVDYKPTGPDLAPMLHGMLLWSKPGHEVDHVLSHIAEELPA